MEAAIRLSSVGDGRCHHYCRWEVVEAAIRLSSVGDGGRHHHCRQGAIVIVQKSLFTLANMFNNLKKKQSVSLICGSSEMLINEVFKLTDDQLIDHCCNLLEKSNMINKLDIELIKKNMKKKMSDSFRNKLIDNLQKMACSELYIGRAPYQGKKTIQTIFNDDKIAKGIENRSAPLSIKFCFNRIVDMFYSTTLDPSVSNPSLSPEQLETLDGLGTLLSNIVCYVESGDKTLYTLHQAYSDITLDQMKKMDDSDRMLVAYQMQLLGFSLNPLEDQFPEKLYDALWQLAGKMHQISKNLEQSVYSDALSLTK